MGYRGVVLAVPVPLPPGLAPWLRSRSWHAKANAWDRNQLALLLVGGNAKELLSLVPKPPGHGSFTPGAYLPW